MKKTLNITDVEVLSHLKKQSNQSKYVTKLVRDDIINDTPALTRNDIVVIVKQVLLEEGYEKKTNTPVEESVSEKAKDAMLSVLNNWT